jgi:uncharacterized protein YjbI with pentapeptide repeats
MSEDETSSTAPAPDIAPMAAKPDELEAIKKAVDDAASVSGGLWLSYLFVLFYLAVAAGAVTHADLFLENAVKLPFLNIELPLLAFFFLAPILFIIVHAYTLVHLVMLTEKTKRYDQALHDPARQVTDTRRAILQWQLPGNIFIQFLAGPKELRTGWFGWALRVIAWITLVIAPVLLLLLMQVQFLPYHSMFITWSHRLALLADLILIWWLWRKILSGHRTDKHPSFWRVFTKNAFAGELSVSVILFATLSATIPNEWLENHFTRVDQLKVPVSVHDLVFNSPIDDVSRRRWLPFSSTLVLSGLNIYEALKIDDPDKVKGRDYIFRASGRDLSGAIFDFATLPKVDFKGTDLQNAGFQQAQLQGDSFDRANLRGARFFGAQLQNASLSGAQLQSARLDAAQLQGSVLTFAHLQGASLDLAHLQGALLDSADLEGASLRDAQLQGATLTFAQLQGATLDAAWLKGAVLNSAHLEGASMDLAKLSGASLQGAQLQGASLLRADLVATDLSTAFLWRADFGATSKHGAAALVALKLPSASDQWLPVWMKSGNEVQPWSNDGYQDLRESMQLIPAGPMRDLALDRIRRLDCANPDSTLASCSPQVEDTSQQKSLEDARVDDSTYAKYLAAVLKDLVCNGVDNGGFYFKGRMPPMIGDGAIYVLRGLMYAFPPPNRIEATGLEAAALIDSIGSKDCLAFTTLSDADRAVLLQIQRSVGKTPVQ